MCTCTCSFFNLHVQQHVSHICFTNASAWQVKFKITLCYCALNENRPALAEVILSLNVLLTL